jgi:tetratricopeptide (TPR) repeat protein
MNKQQRDYILNHAGRMSTKHLAKKLGLKTREVIAVLNPQKGNVSVYPNQAGPGTIPTSWLLKTFFCFLILGALIYSNTFKAEFQFDDGHVIVENSAIRSLRNIAGIWEQSPARFLTHLSFAVNYRFCGYDPVGYHLVNLLIHTGAGFLTSCLIWLSLKTPGMRGFFPRSKSLTIALFGGLIFLCHPLQTQAVTYVVQRLACLATLFYLAAMVFYARARLNGDIKSYLLSLLFGVAGMFAKEISLTLPLMIAGWELIFFGRDSALTRRRLAYLLPVFCTLFIIPALYQHGHYKDSQITQPLLSPADYFCTQLSVIRTYLRLLLVPIGQNFYHDYRVAHGLWEIRTLASLLLLTAIVLAGIYLRKRQRLVAFGILWFFVALSVESGFIPISDVIFEHRLYLPMAGFAMVVAASTVLVFKRGRQAVFLLSMLVVVLSILTYHRNVAWQSRLSLWQDTVKKSPRKADAHVNLGLAYSERGDYPNAIVHYRKALELGLVKSVLYDGLAFALENTGNIEQARAYYEKAVAVDPADAEAHNNLGSIYFNYGRREDGIREMSEAVRRNPYYLRAYLNLGNAHASEKRYDEAEAILQKALAIDPASEEVLGLLKKIEKSRANTGANRAGGN